MIYIIYLYILSPEAPPWFARLPWAAACRNKAVEELEPLRRPRLTQLRARVTIHALSCTCISWTYAHIKRKEGLHTRFQKKKNMILSPHFVLHAPRAFAYGVPKRLSHMDIRIYKEKGEKYCIHKFQKKNMIISPHFVLHAPWAFAYGVPKRLSHMDIRILVYKEKGETYCIHKFQNKTW